MINFEELHHQTVKQCERYVEAFCEIMGYDMQGNYYFVGDDPFGPVAIGDEFWNMSDIQYVISDYDKWKEKYGKYLSDVVMQWYLYSTEVHERNYEAFESKRWRKANEEPEENQDVIIRFADGDIFHSIYHHGEFHDIWDDVCTYKTPDYWRPTNFVEEEHKPINLKSWLMGWRPDMKERLLVKEVES